MPDVITVADGLGHGIQGSLFEPHSVGVPWLEKSCWMEQHKFKPESQSLNPTSWTTILLHLVRAVFDVNRIRLVLNISSFLPHVWQIQAWEAMQSRQEEHFEVRRPQDLALILTVQLWDKYLTSLRFNLSSAWQSCCEGQVKLYKGSLRYTMYSMEGYCAYLKHTHRSLLFSLSVQRNEC